MHILSQEFLEILDGSVSPPEARPTPVSVDLPPSPEQIEEIPKNPTFPIPIINLHPALPGAFDGANAIGRAYASFQAGEIKETGVMVHEVVREVDAGEPIVVRKVECRVGETLEELEERIHKVEHEIIVDGARIVLEGLQKKRREEQKEGQY